MEKENHKTLNTNIPPLMENYLAYAKEVIDNRFGNNELITKFVDRYNNNNILQKYKFQNTENGYKIKHNCNPGTEYEDGEGTLTIYWD